VHPTVVHRLVPGCKVADVGTGTAVFLQDLSKHVNDPSIQLYGFDISTDQFPPPSQLASNITLKVGDAKSGFLKEYHGQFDIVHLRLLYAATTCVQDWHDIAQNAMALLKPGGHLQWMEGTLNQVANVLCAIPGGDPDFAALLHESMVQMHMFCPMDFAWAGTKLGSALTAAGAGEVKHEMTSTDRVAEDRPAFTRLMVDVFRTLASCSAKMDAPGAWDLEMVNETYEKLKEMAKSEKVYVRFDIHVFIAKRA
jgi:SAM-dependent methyltransferase